ncbi:hypothetical protein J2W21_000593 [Sinomonas atrocyanea]|uniref:hypothetical protein n=1 Tax=Sinomonas atrocyanea TaxID=37927 RepID=UPI00277F65C0|nr:hypothetical protein [Sinomonas atrocyanea]MDP9883103.1 hypothetical protein [Sinomonas atrocyanea]
MSLEVLLIPLGIAAIAAIKEARSSDLCEKCKATRIEDQSLLVEALQALGATDIQQTNGRLTAKSRFGQLTFARVGKAFLGRVDGAESATPSMLAELDSAVGSILQFRTVESVREQAASMGLTLITQTAQDGTVQLVFEEQR